MNEEKILKPESIIEYQNGSVVSKTLIKKKSGTLTVFAFDKGEALSEHAAPFDAFVTVLDGKVEIKIGDDFFVLEKEEMILLPANIPHALKAVEKFKMMLVMIKEVDAKEIF